MAISRRFRRIEDNLFVVPNPVLRIVVSLIFCGFPGDTTVDVI